MDPISSVTDQLDIKQDLHTGCSFGNNTSTETVHRHETDHEFGIIKNEVKFIDDQLEEHAHKLFTPIRARQFFQGKTLYREKGLRKVSWDELFLDLVYVASFNKIGHYLYYPSWSALSQFLVVLYPVVNSWQLYHWTSNRYGDNTYGRIFLWVTIVLVSLMGCSAEQSFATESSENTGNVFIGTFLVFRLIFLAYSCLGIMYQPQVCSFST